MVYCGIDFSMTSTAVTVESEKKETFYSFAKDMTKTIQRDIENYINIKNINYKNTEKDLEYSSAEYIKLENLDSIISEIYDIIPEDSIIGIEGLSYGGIGSRSLDLAGFQYALRYKIFSGEKKYKKIFIISPKTLKKFICKGNAKKEEILETFLKSEYDNEIKKLLLDKTYLYTSTNGTLKVKKPIDDILDSFYIKEYLKTLV